MAILSAGLNHPQGGQMQYEFYSGGTSYMVNVFIQSGTLYVPVNKTAVILMMGGGGSGGGSYGDQDTGKGGGGAGGCCFHTSYSLSSSTANYQIHVGQGGRGRKISYNSPESQRQNCGPGEDTYAFGVIARGGGQGGGGDNNNRSTRGGCGGGGGARNNNSGWNNGSSSDQDSFSGWTVYGNSGGNAGGNGNYSGGGGGGIGGSGGGASGGANSSNSTAGSGGAGRDFSSYFGTRVGHNGWFGGGGGGGTYRHGTNTTYNAPPNNGGNGGGGYGNSQRESQQGTPSAFNANYIDAMDGTGGGGGGPSEHSWGVGNYEWRITGHSTGSGGSGIVIVRTPI